MSIDRSNWQLVKLGDLVQRVKDTVNIDDCGLEHYLGGEHFNTDDLHVNGRGIIEGSTIGPAFTMRFQPGHVLLVSRNPHLRKMAVADFTGVCSNVTYVCETKSDSLLQEFLPFIISSSDFWNFAEANKRGSTNFYLNWSDFARYEFLMPPIDEQKRITEVLWATDEVVQKYIVTLSEMQTLYDCVINDIFGKLYKEMPLVDFSKVGQWRSGGTPSRNNPNYWNGDISWISPKDMKQEVITDSIEKITSNAISNTTLRLLPKGSILFVVRGMILAHTFPIGVTRQEVTINQDMKAVIPSDEFAVEYIFHWLKYMSNKILSVTEESSHGTKRLSSDVLGKLKIPLIPRNYQDEVTAKFEKAREECANCARHISKIKSMSTSLHEYYLGGAN